MEWMPVRGYLRLELEPVLRELELEQEAQTSSYEWKCYELFSMHDIWRTKSA